MADPIFSPAVGSISPALDLSTQDLKPIDPLAREKLGGFPDPFAGFADAPANFDQFQDAPAAPDAFANFKNADDLDVKSVDELNADRTNFNPVSYFQSNPDAASDPAKLAKLLAIYRKRREEGLDAGEVAKAALKETPGLLANVGGGIKRLGERAIDVTVQPISNVVLGALTGDLFDEQKRNALFNETRKIIKKGTAETAAGSEAATVGLVDLSRQGLRKLDTAFTPVPLSAMGEVGGPVSIPLKKPLTDQELLRDISDDVAFRQNAAEILTGQGEAAKGLGLDKETLAKQGIELDEKAIEQLSLVDPITMVATGGAFKLVGAAGKVLGTARTLEGAKLIADKLANIAKYSAGKTVQGAGKLITGTGTLLKGTGASLGTVAGISSAVSGGGIPQALIVGAATRAIGPGMRKLGPAIEHAGKAIAGEVPVSAALQRVVDYAAIPGRAATEATKGAFTGIAAAAPFAVMADEDATAGALFGAGGALGAGHAAVALPLRVVKGAAARRYFGENRPVLENIESPGYGDAPSDALHETQLQKLSMQDASEVNNFRELLRPLGKKILAVDAPTFRAKIKEVMPDATPEQLDIFENHSAFFDSKDSVYLNTDTQGTAGLKHDAGHLFDALLTPEKRTELRTAIKDAFGQKSIDDFKETYQRSVGDKISDAAALDEYIAEQFNALFYNVPVPELTAPKSLLNKFIDTVAEGAESLGIDLTGGATTPLIGAPVSVGIRKLFQNAAGEVTRRSVEAKAQPAPVPAPAAPRPAPDLGTLPPDFFGTFPAAPVAPAPVPPVAPVAPAPVPPVAPVAPAPAAPNIRVTPEQVGAFTRTPEAPAARAAAAARAAETGVDYARAEAKKEDGSPTSKIIEQISDAMESGKPVVGIEHLGITSASTPAAPAGRTPRRGEQAGGYAALEAAQIDVRQNAPPEIVALHSKNFVPVRWTDQGGTPTLIAMSLDKVISNILKVAADPKAKDLIPYATENGKLTPEGWREVVADAQAYSENQANGRRGDGGRLEVPEAGLSIPAENPTYTPKPLTPERANFQNLVQGLAPPQTSRAQAGVMPGNVKGQILAEANRRPVELPVNIPTKQAGKQAFAEFPPRVVQEVNPLRNALEKAGVNTRNLLEVTERIRAKDIVSAKTRPDVNYQAPVTDVIRGGFAPAPEKFRSENLAGQTVEDFSTRILALTPDQWSTEAKAMTNGLTGGAWDLGLGLKTPAELATLKSFADKATEAGKTAMNAGDFDTAGSQFTRSQFFREAAEAATGTGSAGLAFTKGAAGEFKPPFPAEIQGGTFAPRTELGRKLEERGFEIVPSGELGSRGVTIFNILGEEVASISSVQRSPKNAEIALVRKVPGAPKGLGEVLYREVGAQLRDDGVTKVGGQVVAPEPMAIRKKVFGDFESIEVNAEPASYEQALAAAERIRSDKNEMAFIEPVSRITAETRFAPRKRDPQGRPLDKDGNIDYAKWQKEGIAAVKKQRAEPIEAAEQTGPVTSDTAVATGWILPNKEFVPLDAAFHEQYLANNAEELNAQYGTNFSDVSSPDARLAALNAGFVRFRNQNGRLSIEVNSAKWPSLKSKVLETLQDRESKFDSLTVSLLNDEGQQVDSTTANRLHEMTGPEKLNAIEEAVSTVRPSGPRFAPAGEGLPGFEDVSPEQAGRLKAKRRIAAVKKNNPEAVSPQYARDESGEIIVTPDGNPKPLTLDYDFINSPVSKEAAKGLKGTAREEAAAEAIGNKLVDFYKEVEKNPEIKAGSKWYSTARTRLRKVFGDDSKFFAELLGATSARTPVETNYRFALDAYNQFKAGAYDKTLAKYREGKAAWDAQDLGDFKGETRGQFIDYWVRKHDLGVTQSSGKKFGMNSRAVLRVLDGSWASEVKGPKTPNFAGNLTGESFAATVDVWAGRTLHRLSNEGRKDRWRILPENEVGINDADFYLGQAAYESAAKKLGIRADALQAVLWFGEKDRWEKNGWTRGAGAEKSDFNVLLGETEKTPEGTLRLKTPQAEFGLDISASLGDIVKKKR